jgi:hypothetical protein
MRWNPLWLTSIVSQSAADESESSCKFECHLTICVCLIIWVVHSTDFPLRGAFGGSNNEMVSLTNVCDVRRFLLNHDHNQCEFSYCFRQQWNCRWLAVFGGFRSFAGREQNHCKDAHKSQLSYLANDRYAFFLVSLKFHNFVTSNVEKSIEVEQKPAEIPTMLEFLLRRVRIDD